MNYKKEEATDLLKKLGIELKHEDQDKDGKALLKVNIVYHIMCLLIDLFLQLSLRPSAHYVINMQHNFSLSPFFGKVNRHPLTTRIVGDGRHERPAVLVAMKSYRAYCMQFYYYIHLFSDQHFTIN